MYIRHEGALGIISAFQPSSTCVGNLNSPCKRNSFPLTVSPRSGLCLLKLLIAAPGPDPCCRHRSSTGRYFFYYFLIFFPKHFADILMISFLFITYLQPWVFSPWLCTIGFKSAVPVRQINAQQVGQVPSSRGGSRAGAVRCFRMWDGLSER